MPSLGDDQDLTVEEVSVIGFDRSRLMSPSPRSVLPAAPAADEPDARSPATKSTLFETIIHREICRLTEMQARRNGFIRDDPIGSTAHDAVAFAGSFLEPRPVNFDQAPPIRSDSTNGTEFGNHLCHGRPSHSKQLRKRL